MGMKREEDPQLWDLLGRSKGAAPSSFFARNVVRAVRAEIPERDGLSGWFNLRRLVPAPDTAHWSEFQRGRHFPAMEAPAQLAGDLQSFFGPLQ